MAILHVIALDHVGAAILLKQDEFIPSLVKACKVLLSHFVLVLRRLLPIWCVHLHIMLLPWCTFLEITLTSIFLVPTLIFLGLIVSNACYAQATCYKAHEEFEKRVAVLCQALLDNRKMRTILVRKGEKKISFFLSPYTN